MPEQQEMQIDLATFTALIQTGKLSEQEAIDLCFSKENVFNPNYMKILAGAHVLCEFAFCTAIKNLRENETAEEDLLPIINVYLMAEAGKLSEEKVTRMIIDTKNQAFINHMVEQYPFTDIASVKFIGFAVKDQQVWLAVTRRIQKMKAEEDLRKES